jgi:hypothetical protein
MDNLSNCQFRISEIEFADKIGVVRAKKNHTADKFYQIFRVGKLVSVCCRGHRTRHT